MKRNQQEEIFNGENEEDQEVVFINRKLVQRKSSSKHLHFQNPRTKKEGDHHNNTSTYIDGEVEESLPNDEDSQTHSSNISTIIFPKTLLDSYVKARQVKNHHRDANKGSQTSDFEVRLPREKRYEKYKKEKKEGQKLVRLGEFKPADIVPFDDLKRIVVKNQRIFRETTERVLSPSKTLTNSKNLSLISVQPELFRRGRTPSPSLHTSYRSVKYLSPSRSESRMSLADVATIFENYLTRTSSLGTLQISVDSNNNSPTSFRNETTSINF